MDGEMPHGEAQGGGRLVRRSRAYLRAVVDAAVTTVCPIMCRRGHRLTVSLPCEAVAVNADPRHLEQVLTTLLVNAARFAHARGYVDLIAAQTAAGLIIRVRDDGMGISSWALPHMFEDSNTALALSRLLIELDGGAILARSDGLGAGAEFVVVIPGND